MLSCTDAKAAVQIGAGSVWQWSGLGHSTPTATGFVWRMGCFLKPAAVSVDVELGNQCRPAGAPLTCPPPPRNVAQSSHARNKAG